MLVTLTTIAAPRCNEGVGMSVVVGRSLGPLFIVIFYVYDSDAFNVIIIDTFCDYQCSDSVKLRACQILRFINRFSTCVEGR